MDPMLASLLPLATLDDEIFERRESVRRARQTLDKAARTVDALREELAGVVAERKADQAEERRHDDELRRLQGLRDSAKNALANGFGDPAVAERQIASCEGLIDEHETASLEILERRDALDARIDELTEALEQAKAAHAAEQAKLEPRIEAWRLQIEHREAKRSGHVDGLERDIRQQYLATHRIKGSALARLDDGACVRCRTVVPLMMGSDVRRGKLVTCSGCGRWLYADAAPTTA